jgi:diguanylate cyclase (GGDEF)-like protein/PAS domain S-box-containing protein
MVAGIILMIACLLAGLVVFVVMQRHVELLLSKSLQLTLQSRVKQTKTEILAGYQKTLLIPTRPLLVNQLQLAGTHANFSAVKSKLQLVARALLQTGLTAIAMYDQDGHELARAGTFSKQPRLKVPLNLPEQVQLMWDGRLILHMVMDIKKEGHVVGKVMTESLLPGTLAGLKNTSLLGKTGEQALCVPFGNNMQCFPTTLSPEIFTPAQRSEAGVALPMTHAFEGETGFIITKDYRHIMVAAAYAPVGDLGLGMVLKMDRTELYAPVWQELRELIPLIFGVLVIALLLLRWRLNPLVTRLVRSETEAVQRSAELTREIIERKKSDERFRDQLEAAPDAMVIVNQNADIVQVNSQAINLFGWLREEMLGRKIEVLMPERIRNIHTGHRNNFFVQPRVRAMGAGMELFGLRKDGTEFPIEISLSPLVTSEGALVISAIRDITDRKAAEARIKYLSRVHAVLSGINTLIVRVQDRNELFNEACRVALEAGGFRMAMLVTMDRNTMKLDPVASAGKDEELLTMIKRRLSSSEAASNTMVGLAIREKQAIVSNDSLNDSRAVFGKQYADAGIRSMVVLPLIIAGEAVGTISLYAGEIDFFHEEELNLLTELADDIAFAIDHLDKQEKLNYLAYYDELTGLANRSLFLERLAQYMRSAAKDGYQMCVGLIDLERFKNINDSLGRPVGDELLKQVAKCLINKVSDASLLAHIDADHFAVVLPEIRSDGNLVRLVESLLEAFLGHTFLVNETALRIGIKAGIALFPDDGTDADTLFRNAEAALKKAKSGGDRYLFYTKKMTEAMAGMLTMENQLRRAIDHKEFVLHYQPKVNMVSGKVTGAEALIRWNDPRTGLVAPGRFIPLLEETGLIFEVGRWAMHQAIEDYLRWRKAGLPVVRIAVNVSPLQLRHPGFIDEITQKITVDPHAAEGLELEITESLIMEDVRRSISSLQMIRGMGVTIAIDDFGTGYSSLSYLARLPVDTLKIDRSFVIEMETPEGGALVSTIIHLAHSLNFKVVAEGVETEEQLKLLRLLGCDEMQGFLFSKPVPAEIFEAKFLVLAPAK